MPVLFDFPAINCLGRNSNVLTLKGTQKLIQEIREFKKFGLKMRCSIRGRKTFVRVIGGLIMKGEKSGFLM